MLTLLPCLIRHTELNLMHQLGDKGNELINILWPCRRPCGQSKIRVCCGAVLVASADPCYSCVTTTVFLTADMFGSRAKPCSLLKKTCICWRLQPRFIYRKPPQPKKTLCEPTFRPISCWSEFWCILDAIPFMLTTLHVTEILLTPDGSLESWLWLFLSFRWLFLRASFLLYFSFLELLMCNSCNWQVNKKRKIENTQTR